MPTKTSSPSFNAIVQAAQSVPSSKALKSAEEEQTALEGEIRNEANRLLLKGLRWGTYILFAVIAIRVWHLVGFNQIGEFKLKWLSTEDVQSIDKMLFSSAFGGAVISYLKDKILKPNGSNSAK